MAQQNSALQNSILDFEINFSSSDEPQLPLTAVQLKTLESLLKSQHTRLVHFVRKHLHRDDYLDDLIQQTHLTAFRSWSKFRGESKPETWLFGVAFNLIKNFRCRDNSYRFKDDNFDEQIGLLCAESISEPEEFFMQQERMGSLKQAIEQLPEKMQIVVQLVLLEGFSYQDAALELDLPIGTVRSRLSRARDILRLEIMNLHSDAVY